MWWLLLLLIVALQASTDHKVSKRQPPFLPPPMPFTPLIGLRQMIRERINDRIQFHFQQPDVRQRIQTRVQNKIERWRNITEAKGCFQNEHGYKCCSQKLFTFMGGAFRNPILERLLARVNLQKVVDKVVELVQKHFDSSFEVVIAPRDFASKNTFRSDLMCKTKTPNGKTVLVYATPVPYSTAASGPPRRLTDKEIQSKGLGESLLHISRLSFFGNRTRRH